MERGKYKNRISNLGIRSSIFIYFSVTAVLASVLIGFSIYSRLSEELEDSNDKSNTVIIDRAAYSIDEYLVGIMKLSNTVYYNIIKNTNIQNDGIEEKLYLLYENNKDNIENIALFSYEGELINVAPASRLKEGVDIRLDKTFKDALAKTDKNHFSKPHIQRIFATNEENYKWVITMARAVEITKQGRSEQAVLLIDMNYSALGQLLDEIHLGKKGYAYLTDERGEIIWHPRFGLLQSGREMENNREIANYPDGVHKNKSKDKSGRLFVKTIGYTGWKLVGVAPSEGFSLNSLRTRIFMFFVIGFMLFIVVYINSYISSRISDPIKMLEYSVNEIESGNLDAEVYIGGSYEIKHLGLSIREMASRIRKLMNDMIKEHEWKRKKEFDTLQSQINPHFLYNTLDIIVWMIENEKKSEAVKVVTALARFFRISLSGGRSVITVKNEIEHIRSYLTIQHMRFKNKFDYTIEVEKGTEELASLKLMLQPLVENAVYHGMEYMDGEGRVEIKVYLEEKDLIFSVADNGLGMSEEKVRNLLSKEMSSGSKRGSGIGVKNVNERIKIYFGNRYGLEILSEPDEGTTIRIRLPAIPYTEIEQKERI